MYYFSCSWNKPKQLDSSIVTYLTYRPEFEEAPEVINQLSPADRVDLCKLLSVAVPGTFPLICTKVQGITQFKNFVCKGTVLTDYLKEKDTISLPKHVVVRSKNSEIYFGPRLTRFPLYKLKKLGLDQEELPDCYIIKKIESVDIDKGKDVDRCETEEDEFTENEENFSDEVVSDVNEVLFTADELVNIMNGNDEDFAPCHNSTQIQEMDESSNLTQQHTEIADITEDDTSAGIDEVTIEDIGPEETLESESGFEDVSNTHTDYELEIGYPRETDITGDDPSQDTSANMDQVTIEGIGPEENLESQSGFHSDVRNEDIDILSALINEDENESNKESFYEDSKTKTFPKQKMKYMNMFLHPEHCSSVDIQNLIHCTKPQFLTYVEAMKPHLQKLNMRNHLSVYSKAFLFRLKLAKNKSFSELATLFVIDKKTARMVYKKLLQITYKFHSAIPNIMTGPNEVEDLFEDAARNLDPFYKELFKPFVDPQGLFFIFFG